MDAKTKKEVAKELFTNTTINREQYEVFKGLVDDLDLDISEPEESWEDLFKE